MVWWDGSGAEKIWLCANVLSSDIWMGVLWERFGPPQKNWQHSNSTSQCYCFWCQLQDLANSLLPLSSLPLVGCILLGYNLDRLHTALQKIQSTGVTLNIEKCKFNKDCLSWWVYTRFAWGLVKRNYLNTFTSRFEEMQLFYNRIFRYCIQNENW